MARAHPFGVGADPDAHCLTPTQVTWRAASDIGHITNGELTPTLSLTSDIGHITNSESA